MAFILFDIWKGNFLAFLTKYTKTKVIFWEVKTVAQKISKFWEIAIRVFNLVKQTRPGEQDF